MIPTNNMHAHITLRGSQTPYVAALAHTHTFAGIYTQPSCSQHGLREASQTKLQMFQWIGVAGHNEAVRHAER